MFKKIKMAVCAAVIPIAFASSAFADNISVTIDGSAIEFDVQPQIVNDRTMVPMRKIFEELGANVQWIGEHQMILASKGDTLILMQIGKKLIITRNLTEDTETRTELDIAPIIVDGTTLVPVRAVSEALEKDVVWDGATRTVIIK